MKLAILLIIVGLALTNALPALQELQYCVDPDGIDDVFQSLALSGADSTDTTLSIDLSSYSYGMHHLALRVRDAQNRWSHFAHRNVIHLRYNETLTHISSNIDDNPPQDLSLSQIGDELWMYSDEISFPPDTAAGLHILKLVAVDAQGLKSLMNTRMVQYLPQAVSSNITRLTWFFSGHEADPLQVYSHNVSPAQNDVTAELILALPNLTPGETYSMNIMAVQENGTSSLIAEYDFAYQLFIDNLIITLNDQQILLNWDEIPGALHYLVETKTDPATEGIWQQVPTNTFSKPISLNKEFYRVKAVK